MQIFFKQLNTVTLKLQLPEYMVDWLQQYSNDWYVDIDKFIEVSIKQNLETVALNIPANIDYNDYENDTLPLEVNVSNVDLLSDISTKKIRKGFKND